MTSAVLTPLGEGHGRVRCAHGVLPVPVPAVANIVAAHGLALSSCDVAGELVTPTGAAIAAAIRTSDSLPEAYTVRAVGTGAGKRAYNPPSTVRAMLIEPAAQTEAKDAAQPVNGLGPAGGLSNPQLWKLETEVDDCTGEALGITLDLLYAAGAREAHFLPVFMKKGRPGYQLEVLCDEAQIPELERVIFENSTTIGVRRTPQWRSALAREIRTVSTPYGEARVKAVALPSGRERLYPEHDDVAALSAAAGASYQDVYRAVLASC